MTARGRPGPRTAALRIAVLRTAVLRVAVLGALVCLAACTTGAVPTHPTVPATGAGTARGTVPAPTRPATDPAHASTRDVPASASADALARAQLARLTLPERVGQLFMVDCPSTGASAATIRAITGYHVGSVILDGDSTIGLAGTRAVTSALQGLAAGGPRLFVATDQEGGLVQRLRGPGFPAIAPATVQGTVAPERLTSDTASWARQLRAAGVNLDLAPVLDTVPAGFGSNPPIGDLDREYGHTPSAVAAHGIAVLRGLAAAGVVATAKHFPGLGRVRGNTDTASGVRDTVTTADDAYLAPFADAVRAGVPFVMMSTAIYTRLDPGVPAAFSKAIVTGLLRDRLGFGGVIISDDLGAAKQVSGYPVGARAVDFVAAGGDVVLTVDPSAIPAMAAALIARAKASPAFRAQVDAAALQVLAAKQRAGLLR